MVSTRSSFEPASIDLLEGSPVKLRRQVVLQVAHQSGQAPCLVFLHGGLGNRYNWRSQFEFAHRQGWEVLAYDLAGHGQSSTDSRYSIGRHCRDLSRLLRRYRIQQPLLCCHSYGVPLGLEWAQRNSVKGLVLIAGGTHELDPWWEVPLMKTLNWGGRHLFHWDWLQAKIRRIASNHERRSVDRFFEESPLPTDSAPYEALEIFWGYNFGERHGGGEPLKQPVLVMTGGQDPSFTEAMGDRLAERFRQAEHLHLPEAGHVLMAEFPEQVNSAIANFIASLA